MALFIPILVGIVALFVLQRIYVALLEPEISSVPGPLLCKFTDLPSFWYTFRRSHVKWLQGLHRQYGPVVRMGPRRFALADPAIISSIYDGKNEFAKSPKMAVMNRVQDGKIMQGMLNTTDKQQHAAIRRPVAKLYNMTNIVAYEGKMDEITRLFVQRLSEEFAKTGRTCDFAQWAIFWSTDIITALTMGKPIGFLQTGKDINGMLKQNSEHWRYYALVKHASWADYILVKNPIRRKFPNTPLKLMQRVMPGVRARVMAKPDASKPPVGGDMLAQFLDAHYNNPKAVPKPRIFSYVGVNMQAGSDTTAIHIRSIVYHALRTQNRKYAKKLQEELDGAGIKYPITLQDSQNLHFLDAVIKEGQRLHHVGSGIVERVVPAGGLKLPDGRVLPEGCEVGVSGSTVQFDKAVWGQDAESFNPERWLRGADESEEHFAERSQGMKNADMTWGRGSRTCLGQNIAKLELAKAVSALFGLFDMALVNPDREWHIEENFFRGQKDIDITLKWREGKSLADIEA